MMREFNRRYEGDHLSRVAMPMGGIGAGMVCLEGSGALSHVSLRHRPELFNEPLIFTALSVAGQDGRNRVARVLQGQVPRWKAYGQANSGNGGGAHLWGLPRFRRASFESQFPLGMVSMSDDSMPVDVRLTGWSPFIPNDADASSLPLVVLEYTLTNTSPTVIDVAFSHHSSHFLRTKTPGASVRVIDTDGRGHSGGRGFVWHQPGSEENPSEEASFAMVALHSKVAVDAAWFRGRWRDARMTVWRHVAHGDIVDQPPHAAGPPGEGASLYVPVRIESGESVTIPILFCWYVPRSSQSYGGEFCDADSGSCGPGGSGYRPWYASRFAGVDEVVAHCTGAYSELRAGTRAFADCFYDTTLPGEVVEAVSSNLSILKSPTVLRQHDGRIWAWEGSGDATGCCAGSCTHVWNYAQAMPHLFPTLERTLRETEYGPAQSDAGKQVFRAPLPIRQVQKFEVQAAADGQLGGIMKIHRDWRISGDTDWLRSLWPAVKRSMHYCISEWDPDHEGILKEPHHNTYDIEFWGPNGMCCSFYLGALRAAVAMGQALGDDISLFRDLYDKGRAFIERELFNGEYFIQKTQWKGLHADADNYTPLTLLMGKHQSDSPEAIALQRREGPRYQYGIGCLADGVLGAWMAEVCGVGSIIDEQKVRSHLLAVHRYNLRQDLFTHVNRHRPTYALGEDGGLLLCTWPRGGEPTIPFPYSDEVWTGFEYHVASHLMRAGHVVEGIEIVRLARQRHDGTIRNPFNEYECGNWYARAMSSYSLLYGLTGARYDAIDRRLTIAPRISGDFRSFLCTATGYGTVGVAGGEPFIDVRQGTIDVRQLDYQPCPVGGTSATSIDG